MCPTERGIRSRAGTDNRAKLSGIAATELTLIRYCWAVAGRTRM